MPTRFNTTRVAVVAFSFLACCCNWAISAQALQSTSVEVGFEPSGVQNRATPSGPRIDDLLQDESNIWRSQGAFLAHISNETFKLLRTGAISATDRVRIMSAAQTSGIGTNGEVEILHTLANGRPLSDAIVEDYAARHGLLDSSAATAGADANQDGVRDDVASLIDAWPISVGRRVAAKKYAMAVQAIMAPSSFSALTVDQAYQLQQELSFRESCLASTSGFASARLMAGVIRGATANSTARRERLSGFLNALSGSSYEAVTTDDCYAR